MGNGQSEPQDIDDENDVAEEWFLRNNPMTRKTQLTNVVPGRFPAIETVSRDGFWVAADVVYDQPNTIAFKFIVPDIEYASAPLVVSTEHAGTLVVKMVQECAWALIRDVLFSGMELRGAITNFMKALQTIKFGLNAGDKKYVPNPELADLRRTLNKDTFDRSVIGYRKMFDGELSDEVLRRWETIIFYAKVCNTLLFHLSCAKPCCDYLSWILYLLSYRDGFGYQCVKTLMIVLENEATNDGLLGSCSSVVVSQAILPLIKNKEDFRFAQLLLEHVTKLPNEPDTDIWAYTEYASGVGAGSDAGSDVSPIPDADDDPILLKLLFRGVLNMDRDLALLATDEHQVSPLQTEPLTERQQVWLFQVTGRDLRIVKQCLSDPTSVEEVVNTWRRDHDATPITKTSASYNERHVNGQKAQRAEAKASLRKQIAFKSSATSDYMLAYEIASLSGRGDACQAGIDSINIPEPLRMDALAQAGKLYAVQAAVYVFTQTMKQAEDTDAADLVPDYDAKLKDAQDTLRIRAPHGSNITNGLTHGTKLLLKTLDDLKASCVRQQTTLAQSDAPKLTKVFLRRLLELAIDKINDIHQGMIKLLQESSGNRIKLASSVSDAGPGKDLTTTWLMLNPKLNEYLTTMYLVPLVLGTGPAQFDPSSDALLVYAKCLYFVESQSMNLDILLRMMNNDRTAYVNAVCAFLFWKSSIDNEQLQKLSVSTEVLLKAWMHKYRVKSNVLCAAYDSLIDGDFMGSLDPPPPSWFTRLLQRTPIVYIAIISKLNKLQEERFISDSRMFLLLADAANVSTYIFGDVIDLASRLRFKPADKPDAVLLHLQTVCQTLSAKSPKPAPVMNTGPVARPNMVGLLSGRRRVE